MGRHTDVASRASNGRLPALIIAGVLVLALLAYVVWGLVNRDDDTPGASDEPTSAVTEEPTTDDAAATSDAVSATETADAAPTTAESTEAATPSEELTACAAEVAAGEELAEVAKVGATNWKLHYTASVDYNAGRISLDKANEIFGETKVNVSEEVADYESARTAYEQASGACTELAEAPDDGEFADEAADCADRGQALNDLTTAADKVMGDWSKHGDMMASKAEQDINAYMAEWHHDVATAPENMKPYEEAVAALEEAPACTL